MSWPLCVAMLFFLRLCVGIGNVGGNCTFQDQVDLVQHSVLAMEKAAQREMQTLSAPSKNILGKLKPQIRVAADGLFKRATSKMKLTSSSTVLRWEIVGKVTQWVSKQLQRPKSPAATELVSVIVEHFAQVLGQRHIEDVAAQELVAQLMDWTQLHRMAHNYISNGGLRVLSEAASKALQENADAARATSRANETQGAALAELLAYVDAVDKGTVEVNMSHAAKLYTPVLIQLGAPPAVKQFLHQSAELLDSEAPINGTREAIRTQRFLADAARQLRMPSAVADVLDVTANMTATNFSILGRKERRKIFSHLVSASASLVEQLGGPSALSSLIHHLGRPLLGKRAPSAHEVFDELAQASKEMKLPNVVAECLDYIGQSSARGVRPDPQRIRAFEVQLSEQFAVPDVILKFREDVDSAPVKSDGTLDSTRVIKMVVQFLRKLGMPNFADIVGKVGGQAVLRRSKFLDPSMAAAIAPSLMKASVDLAAATELLSETRGRVLQPLLPFYQTAVENLTSRMPPSALKSTLKRTLSGAAAKA